MIESALIGIALGAIGLGILTAILHILYYLCVSIEKIKKMFTQTGENKNGN